jgi:hypothetical protein
MNYHKDDVAGVEKQTLGSSDASLQDDNLG